MEQRIRLKVFAGLIIVPLIFGSMLFLSAQTIDYWQGWLFLFVYFTTTTVITLHLMKNDPALLKRRMRSGAGAEKRPAQRIIMSCLTLAFLALFIVSGVDHNLGWSHVPIIVVLIGDCMVALSFYIFHLVFKENTFASATIEIAQEQKVIATGPYSIVRHPMYLGGFIFLLGIPLALGSIWAMTIMLPLSPFLIWRIIDEEKLLKDSLAGYSEYCHKVKYRLLPWVY